MATNKLKKSLKVVILSDSTGTTATQMVRAATTQFKNINVYFTRFKNIEEKSQIDAVIEQTIINHDLIVFTLVSEELRKYLLKKSEENNVLAIDLMGGLLTVISFILKIDPQSKPGTLHIVNNEYYKKIEAIEYTLSHDDGKRVDRLDSADIILIGISRTSKTPLSIFLSMSGLKVINIPIIYKQNLPDEIFRVDQKKIFCLTIDPETLLEIRKNRLKKMGLKQDEVNYGEIASIMQEIEWANAIFKRNKRWPVINITDKALEETSAEIIRLIQMRENNSIKQKKNKLK